MTPVLFLFFQRASDGQQHDNIHELQTSGHRLRGFDSGAEGKAKSDEKLENKERETREREREREKRVSGTTRREQIEEREKNSKTCVNCFVSSGQDGKMHGSAEVVRIAVEPHIVKCLATRRCQEAVKLGEIERTLLQDANQLQSWVCGTSLSRGIPHPRSWGLVFCCTDHVGRQRQRTKTPPAPLKGAFDGGARRCGAADGAEEFSGRCILFSVSVCFVILYLARGFSQNNK